MTSHFPPVEEQLAVIRRGVERIVPEDELARKLQESRDSGTPLRIKYGIDPTGIDLHLGHTVPMRKLRQFQKLGHQAVLIIGNYTALVGDPSGRDETRARLTADQVEANAVDYLEQVGRVIDMDSTEVVRNGDWFSNMSFSDVLELTSKVTVAQLLTRDDFSKRFAGESAIYLHECLYPLMQAWDSVMVRSDVELGGTEQLYSLMLARDLQRGQELPQQIAVMSPILVGLDGVRRMGKSLGNYIGIAEDAYEKMKKFMQIPDACLQMYFELLTEIPAGQIAALLAGHPKEAKVTLAKDVITQYHSANEASEAADRWQREIGEGDLPEDIPISEVATSDIEGDGCVPAARLLVLLSLCKSNSEARRSIEQGGAYLGENKERIQSFDQRIRPVNGLMVRVGKKRFCRVQITGGH